MMSLYSEAWSNKFFRINPRSQFVPWAGLSLDMQTYKALISFVYFQENRKSFLPDISKSFNQQKSLGTKKN